MKPKRSAGLLLFRRRERIEVLLVHPGGPFWARKDEHAWSTPKGEYENGEDPETAARREFTEELGASAPTGPWIDLGEMRQPSGKLVRAWAVEGDFDPIGLVSNTFELEWPRDSGRIREYPEVDRAAWFDLTVARRKLHRGQVPFIDALVSALETSN
ncbi:MAG: NUDIX domain-containing protein [Acidimicrobiia bacterium]